MQQVYIRYDQINEIEKIIYNYIWIKKTGSKKHWGPIRKTVMKQKYENGGLNTPDVHAINNSLKYNHLLKATRSKHPICEWYKKELINIKFSWEKQGTIYGKQKKPETYLENCKETHRLIWARLDSEFLDMISDKDTMDHKEYYINLFNHKIEGSIHTNGEQTYIIKKLKLNGINTFGDLFVFKKEDTNNRLWYEIHQMYHTFPNHWRNVIKKCKRDYRMHTTNQFCIDRNKWISEDLVTCRDIRLHLQQSNIDTVNLNNVEDKFGLTNTIVTKKNNPFILARQCVNSTYLKNLQFRILHNIYPKNKKLHTFKIKPTPWCGACGENETLQHVLTECRIAKETIKNLSIVLHELGLDGIITKRDIILGRNDSLVISHILMITKAALIRQDDNEKRILTTSVLKNMISQEYKVELYNSTSIGQLRKTKVKWKCMK